MSKKAPNTHQWGSNTAKERYGSGSKDFERPADQHGVQAEIGRPAAGYDNDVPLSGWLRGKDSTKKPGFTKPWDKR